MPNLRRVDYPLTIIGLLTVNRQHRGPLTVVLGDGLIARSPLIEPERDRNFDDVRISFTASSRKLLRPLSICLA